MRIAYITAGAAGMYCGSCLHDNTLAAALQQRGHDVALIPMYTPIRTDEDDVSIDRVFYGAVNVYLEQRWKLFQRSPGFLHWLLDRPALLRGVLRLAGPSATQGEELGQLALSVLRGEDGRQRPELERLVAWLRDDFKPQIVHITNALLLGLARSLKRELSVPVLCGVQGEDLFIDEIVEPYRTRFVSELRAHAIDVDGFVAPNRYYADHVRGYLGTAAEKIRVVRLGVTLHGRETRARPADAPFTIGFLARQCPEKGLHRLIAAFRQLTQRAADQPIRLRVAGYVGKRDAAYVDEQRRLVADQGLSGQVDWVGEVDRDAKMQFLGSIDVLCLPTVYRESKGLPALEAMASSVPVVVPAHGGFPELIEWTGGGLLFDPDSEEAVVDALEALMRDPERRRELGRAGRQVVERELSDEAMAAATLREYERWVCTS